MTVYINSLDRISNTENMAASFPTREEIAERYNPPVASLTHMFEKIEKHDKASMLIDFGTYTVKNKDGQVFSHNTFTLFNPDLFVSNSGQQTFNEVGCVRLYREANSPYPAWCVFQKSEEGNDQKRVFRAQFVPLTITEIEAIPEAQEAYERYKARLEGEDTEDEYPQNNPPTMKRKLNHVNTPSKKKKQ